MQETISRTLNTFSITLPKDFLEEIKDFIGEYDGYEKLFSIFEDESFIRVQHLDEYVIFSEIISPEDSEIIYEDGLQNFVSFIAHLNREVIDFSTSVCRDKPLIEYSEISKSRFTVALKDKISEEKLNIFLSSLNLPGIEIRGAKSQIGDFIYEISLPWFYHDFDNGEDWEGYSEAAKKKKQLEQRLVLPFEEVYIKFRNEFIDDLFTYWI